MRIGMLLDKTFPPDPRVGNEARTLARAGHDVALYCLRHDDGSPERETWEAGVRLIRDRMERGFYKKASALALTAPFYFDRWRRLLARRVHEERPDVLHVHDLPLLAVAVEIGTGAGVPVVADLHENYPAAVATYAYANRFPGNLLISPDRWRRYERRWLPRARRVIVVVEEAAARVGALGLEPRNVTVISNTVDVDEFEGFPRDAAIHDRLAAGFTAVYLGGFDRHRGLETAVEAAALVVREEPTFQLVLVGDGATRRALERQVAERGLEGVVRFEGWQPFRLFPSYVGGARVALIPHVRNEHTDTTIPHKLFHYMLLERPVVSSDCAPLARIVRETGAGAVFPSGSAEGLAASILGFRDPARAAEAGRSGRAAVLSTYNWERSGRDLVSLYANLP